MFAATKTRTVRKRTVSYTYVEEPVETVPTVSVDVREMPGGVYRVEATGLSRQKAYAAAKYIIGVR